MDVSKSRLSGDVCRLIITSVVIALCSCPGQAGYNYDASDFATSVISYTPGTGIGADYITGDPFSDPSTALGRPTVDTTGDDWYFPVSEAAPIVAVYQPFRAYELVTVGGGGSLTVKFDNHVENDPHNPYGIDLIVYGNASQHIGGGLAWTNRDPNLTSGGAGGWERGIVSVSQDGQTWYTFTNGPYADDFAPTLGRQYDTANPDTSIGAWNEWWGAATNPTMPLDPTKGFSDFSGLTVAQIAQAYRNDQYNEVSAGGAGFDLDDVGAGGLDWIQYVRVADDPNRSATTEIDAFADVRAMTPGDADKDGDVDDDDYTIWAGNYGVAGASWDMADFTGDGKVTDADYTLWANNYEIPVPGGVPTPEPGTAVVLVIGGLATLIRRQ